MLEWMPRPPNATGLLRHYTSVLSGKFADKSE